MTAQKIHIILFSSILILFCVRIAHTAPAEQQQDSSDFTIIDLCMSFITTINVDSSDTGFILTSSNCSSQFGEAFQLNYVDADANDAEVIFGWSSTSGVSISTGDNGQIQVQKVTANESYWNPPGGVNYYFPNGHNVTLTVYKGCFKSNVTDESVKSERLVSDARKERFTCENSKQLVNNMNQFSGSQVLSCELNTRTWENYDVSCNGPLKCVDLKNTQKSSRCEVWRVHENAGVNVTCSNANSADEPSFNLTCENRQQVLGILGSPFRSEVGSLEVTCKGASGTKSWFTSTNETIPPLSYLGCLDRSDPNIMGAAVTTSSDKPMTHGQSGGAQIGLIVGLTVSFLVLVVIITVLVIFNMRLKLRIAKERDVRQNKETLDLDMQINALTEDNHHYTSLTSNQEAINEVYIEPDDILRNETRQSGLNHLYEQMS